MLMEEFQNNMPEEMKMYLNERKIKSSHEMTTLADEYDIAHKKKQSENNKVYTAPTTKHST